MLMWCVAPLEMNEGNSLGQGYNGPTGCSAEKAPHATFMPHLVFCVRYSVVIINYSLFTVTYSSVRTTLAYNDTKYSAPFMTL